MSTPAPPTPAPYTGPAAPAPRPVLDSAFGSLWPETRPAGRPVALAMALGVGMLAALVVPGRSPGIGSVLVLVAGGAAATSLLGRRRVTPALAASLTLAGLLVATLALRDAAWVTSLCVLAVGPVAVSGVVGTRTVPGLLGAVAAVPLAGLRGLPWLGRSLAASRGGSWLPALRTAAVSLGLVGVLVALFASADPLFSRWVDAAVPDLGVDVASLRMLVLVVASGTTLASSYVVLNPPRPDQLALTPRIVTRGYEWLVPVGLVVAVYLGFVAAQATAMFGGHDHLRATTGLTYADYVHQGFGQLTVATALTLGIVAAAARRAPRRTTAQRQVLRAALGALCVLTLVVVASALFRLHVYEQAYGVTRLRVLVGAFEAWLGVVVLLVLGAGVRLRGGWIPRVAVLVGASTLLGLALANPDAYIAGQNLERYQETQKVDWDYLAGLSADAVPTLARLPIEDQACVFGPDRARDDDPLEWNLGRVRAAERTLVPTGRCQSP